MKVTLRIPTADQFAFIEPVVEVESIEEAYRMYESAISMVKVGVGLEPKEWNAVLDKYRQGKGMTADEHERMNRAQSWLIHELDKSDSRIK